MSKTKWFEYPNKKPKKDGWYQCTVEFEIEIDEVNHIHKSYVMDLYYYTETNQWRDNRRQNVFDKYEVYGNCEGPSGHDALERIYADNYCILDEVIAWKNLPKPYR